MASQLNSEKARVIVYTAIFGPYDQLKGHRFHIRSICFTNQHNQTASNWEVIHTRRNFRSLDEQIREARRYKLLPHKVLPPHEISIWMDASMQLVQDPSTMLTLLGNHEIATFKYPDTYGRRECIYEEATACMRRKKDDPEVIKRHMAKYRMMGYPDNNGLVETTIVIRRNSDKINAFNEEWWRELSSGSRRDQLSFNYVAWKLGLQYSHLPGCRVCNPFATWSPHLMRHSMPQPGPRGMLWWLKSWRGCLWRTGR